MDWTEVDSDIDRTDHLELSVAEVNWCTSTADGQHTRHQGVL